MVNKDTFKVQDKHDHDHLKDPVQASKEGKTDAPGNSTMGESFEQKVNRAPETEAESVDSDKD